MDYKAVLGILSALLMFGSVSFYLCQVIRRRIRPHAFTFVLLALMSGIVFAGMVAEGAGAATWRTGVTLVFYILIAGFTLRNGFGYVKRVDWMILGLALMGIPLWWIADSPQISILWILAVGITGAIPALRKAYALPHEDSLVTPVLNFVAMMMSVAALPGWHAWASGAYLVGWSVYCVVLIAVLMVRRRGLATSP